MCDWRYLPDRLFCLPLKISFLLFLKEGRKIVSLLYCAYGPVSFDPLDAESLLTELLELEIVVSFQVCLPYDILCFQMHLLVVSENASELLQLVELLGSYLLYSSNACDHNLQSKFWNIFVRINCVTALTH